MTSSEMESNTVTSAVTTWKPSIAPCSRADSSPSPNMGYKVEISEAV